jgi:hypothetical protein
LRRPELPCRRRQQKIAAPFLRGSTWNQSTDGHP